MVSTISKRKILIGSKISTVSVSWLSPNNITTNCWCLIMKSLVMKSLGRLDKILYNEIQIKFPGDDKRNFTQRNFTHNHDVKDRLWYHAKFVVLFKNNIIFLKKKSGHCLGCNIKHIIILASNFFRARSKFSLWYTSCISASILQL